MVEENDSAAPAPDPAPTNPNDFSALLERPVYEVVEKGADRQGYETRDIKPGERK